MKIKNWKKEFDTKYGIMYKNDFGNRLFVYQSKIFDKWYVKYGKIYKRKEGRHTYYYGGKKLGDFGNKSEAINFAVKFMKKHFGG